jgi:hypothetical protein
MCQGNQSSLVHFVYSSLCCLKLRTGCFGCSDSQVLFLLFPAFFLVGLFDPFWWWMMFFSLRNLIACGSFLSCYLTLYLRNHSSYCYKHSMEFFWLLSFHLVWFGWSQHFNYLLWCTLSYLRTTRLTCQIWYLNRYSSASLTQFFQICSPVDLSY